MITPIRFPRRSDSIHLRARVGVITTKSSCGPYTHKSSFEPLGANSRDEGFFPDGVYDHVFQVHLQLNHSVQTIVPGETRCNAQAAYLLCASDNNQDIKISQLDANYRNVTT